MSHQLHSILLTIDVEDWFQVENFKQCIPFSSWPSRELRVEKNTHKILDLLDSQKSEVKSQRSISTNSSNLYPACPVGRHYRTGVKSGGYLTGAIHSLCRRQIEFHHFHPESDEEKKSNQSGKSCLTKRPKATFFILGWIAERLPHLVREIHSRGHEVASHGYLHNLCNQQSHEELKKDLIDSKKLLEDIIGTPVFGYRAPSFAINNDILKIIEDCGYLYDSSYNSFAMHGRYGHLDLSRNGRKGIAFPISAIRNPHPSTHYQLSAMPAPWNPTAIPSGSYPHRQPSIINHQSSIFFELPISNLKFLPHGAAIRNHILPWGGGGYFRLIPFPVFKMGVQSILQKQGAYLLYLHPWELDPEQPRVKDAPAFFKFRHYINLDKTASKLSSFITAFKKCRFITCYDYLLLRDG